MDLQAPTNLRSGDLLIQIWAQGDLFRRSNRTGGVKQREMIGTHLLSLSLSLAKTVSWVASTVVQLPSIFSRDMLIGEYYFFF